MALVPWSGISPVSQMANGTPIHATGNAIVPLWLSDKVLFYVEFVVMEVTGRSSARVI